MKFFRRQELNAAVRGWSARSKGVACTALLCTMAARGQGTPQVAVAVKKKHAIVKPGSAKKPVVVPEQAVVGVPGLNPDEDDDGLMSLQGLPATQTPVVSEAAEAPVPAPSGAAPSVGSGAGTSQHGEIVQPELVDGVNGFLAVAMGAGSNPAPDPEGDSDSAGLTVGPGYGLGRGRRAGFRLGLERESELRGGVRNYSASRGSVPMAVKVFADAGEAHYHGGLEFRVRSSELNARNSLAVATSYRDGVVTSGLVKPHDLRETISARVGGPVPGVRGMRFFDALAVRRRGFPAVSSPTDPAFYALTTGQKTLLLNRGVSLAQQNAGLNYVSSLTGEVERRADGSSNLARVDWARGARLAVTGAYRWERWSSPAGLVDAPVVARGRASLGSNEGSVDQVQASAVARVKSLLVETTASLGRDLQYERGQAPLAQEPAGGVAGTAPAVEIGPQGLLFGTPPTVGAGAYPDERQERFGAVVRWQHGSNALVVGASAGFVQDAAGLLRNAAGTFRYDSGRSSTSAGGLVDFLTDYTYGAAATFNGACPSVTAAVHLYCFQSFSQSFGSPAVAFSTAQFAGFVEDTWSPRAGLTVQLGTRYDYLLLPLPQSPNASVDGVFGPRGATSVFPEDRNNAGPRASVAWEPLGAGRGTIRAGYGLFYGRLPGATIAAALTDTARTGATSRIRITPATLAACPQVAGQSFGYPCSFAAMPVGAVAQTTSAVVFERGFRLPAIQQASLTVERSFGRVGTFSFGYVGNLDRQLPTSTDLNIVASTRLASYQLQGGPGAGQTFQLPLYTSRVTPTFGPVTAIRSSANGTYHALEVRGEGRPVSSVRVQGAVTWSKAIDYGPNVSATPRTDAQLDPFANGYDKGRSSLDYPWAATAACVWRVRRFDVSGVWTARAGRPYSYDLFGGTRLPGGHQSLNGSGGALYLPTVGRNTLRLPARERLDLRVAREFGMGHVKVRGEVEAFNALNSRQVTSVVQRAYLVGTAVGGVTPLVFQDAAAIAAEGLTAQPFGTVNATGSSGGRERQLEFGVRVEF